jgi:hypothetical protein
MLCGIARYHGHALCQHSAGPYVFVYISANLQQNSKIFWSMNQGPKWDCLMKKTRGRKSRDTVFLMIPKSLKLENSGFIFFWLYHPLFIPEQLSDFYDGGNLYLK